MGPRRFGHPRRHLRSVDSTNALARRLAARGAPDGTLVSAEVQTAGRGRQGRTWSAPPGRALLCSVLVRSPPRMLPLAAGVAVAETAEVHANGRVLLKWPNDVLLDSRKLAGILVEGRPQEGWAVLGVGLNVAVRHEELPPELRDTAATLGLAPAQIEPVLERLIAALERWVAAPEDDVLAAFGDRDALRGRPVSWAGGEGVGAGVDRDGRLVVALADGSELALDAGEVHLGR